MAGVKEWTPPADVYNIQTKLTQRHNIRRVPPDQFTLCRQPMLGVQSSKPMSCYKMCCECVRLILLINESTSYNQKNKSHNNSCHANNWNLFKWSQFEISYIRVCLPKWAISGYFTTRWTLLVTIETSFYSTIYKLI